MKLAKILAIVGVSLLLVLSILTLRDLNFKIDDNKLTAQRDISMKINYLQNQISDLQNQIDTNYASMTLRLTRQEVALVNKYCELIQKLQQLPKEEQEKRTALEHHLQRANVLILNRTEDIMGSGIILKYKDKFYILSAGHMVDNGKDVVYMAKNGLPLYQLEVIKHEYTFKETDDDINFTKSQDLVLFRTKHINFQPQDYVELADAESEVGEQIYIIGNPLGIENVLSDGRIIKFVNNYMYFIDHSYFGNSGGGVYNRDGKVIGIVSHMIPMQPIRDVPPYMTHGAVRLSAIIQFLKDIR